MRSGLQLFRVSLPRPPFCGGRASRASRAGEAATTTTTIPPHHPLHTRAPRSDLQPRSFLLGGEGGVSIQTFAANLSIRRCRRWQVSCSTYPNKPIANYFGTISRSPRPCSFLFAAHAHALPSSYRPILGWPKRIWTSAQRELGHFG